MIFKAEEFAHAMDMIGESKMSLAELDRRIRRTLECKRQTHESLLQSASDEDGGMHAVGVQAKLMLGGWAS